MLKKKKKTPIFVGGTGLYLDSLINNISNIPPISKKIRLRVNRIFQEKGKNYFYEKLLKIDNSYATKISKNDTQRILRAVEVKVATGKNFSYWHKHKKENIFEKVVYVVLNLERDDLYKKINERCKEMLSEGVVDEVKRFLKNKISLITHCIRLLDLRFYQIILEEKLKLIKPSVYFQEIQEGMQKTIDLV